MSGPQGKAPLVSIIMPARDASRTIDEAIESVVGQSLSDWELLVVDDDSRDETGESVQAWAGRDARIRLLHGAGSGPGAARNRALDEARGTYIHFLDSDDLLRADALATLTAAASESASRAVFGAYERLNPDGQPLDWICRESLTEIGLDELLERNRFPVHAQLLERAAIGDVRFDESLEAVEDWEFWLTLALRGVRWQRIDSVVADYRQGLVTRSGRFRAVAQATQAVVRNAFARAKSCNLSSDLSSDRLGRVQWIHALDIATQASMHDIGAAVEIVRGAAGTAGACVTSAHDAAQAAYWLAPTVRGRGPQEWRCEDGFTECAARVLQLWSSLERAAICPLGFCDAAIDELASLLTPREAIAQDILAQCAGSERVTLLGYGANGRFLAGAFRARGVEVTVCDDAHGAALPASPMGPVIVTPTSDRAIVDRLPPNSTLIRWSETQRRLAEQWRVRLHTLPKNQSFTRRGAA